MGEEDRNYERSNPIRAWLLAVAYVLKSIPISPIRSVGDRFEQGVSERWAQVFGVIGALFLLVPSTLAAVEIVKSAYRAYFTIDTFCGLRNPETLEIEQGRQDRRRCLPGSVTLIKWHDQRNLNMRYLPSIDTILWPNQYPNRVLQLYSIDESSGVETWFEQNLYSKTIASSKEVWLPLSHKWVTISKAVNAVDGKIGTILRRDDASWPQCKDTESKRELFEIYFNNDLSDMLDRGARQVLWVRTPMVPCKDTFATEARTFGEFEGWHQIVAAKTDPPTADGY